jgi:hypothetical protein
LHAFISFQAAAAQFVELTADIQTVHWYPGWTDHAARVVTEDHKVRCVVGTNSWLIEREPAGLTRDAWWFTGSNVVSYCVVVGYPSERTELFERNHPNIVIGRGYNQTLSCQGEIFPSQPIVAGSLEGPTALNAAWLAYCSGPFFRTVHRHIPLPSVGEESLIDQSSHTTVLFKDTLGLPMVVNLYTATNQPILQYGAAGSTNVLGWIFPLEFHITQYRHDYQTGTSEIHLTATGRLTDIRPGLEPSVPTEMQKLVEE